MRATRQSCLTLALIMLCISCGDDGPTQARSCEESRLVASTVDMPDRFVRPSYVPTGFSVEVFEDRGPRRIVLSGKSTAGVVPVVDLQLFAIEPGAEVRTSPEIRQDGAGKFSAKWNIDDRTVLATNAYAAREEFEKVIRSITLADTAELCAFVREHNGQLIAARPATSR
jgi:hypothetical protein